MSHLVLSERLEEQLPRLIPGILALYKKPAEAYYVSKVSGGGGEGERRPSGPQGPSGLQHLCGQRASPAEGGPVPNLGAQITGSLVAGEVI